jgi:glutathione S-transferase
MIFRNSITPNITLYTGQTPNGIKISIALEELGLDYMVRKIDMSADEQKSKWFAEINPNGRIPAITDMFDGNEIRVFESGSILQYLCDKYDKEYKISYPRGTREHVEVSWSLNALTQMLILCQMTNWLFFQNAGVGPM